MLSNRCFVNIKETKTVCYDNFVRFFVFFSSFTGVSVVTGSHQSQIITFKSENCLSQQPDKQFTL